MFVILTKLVDVIFANRKLLAYYGGANPRLLSNGGIAFAEDYNLVSRDSVLLDGLADKLLG